MEVIGILCLFGILFGLLLLKVPVSYSVGIATACTLLLFMPTLPALTTITQQMATGMDSFALLAIPFFVLAGDIMNRGGIANRLISFSKSLVGSFPGGLLYVNIISAAFFGAVSGSAAASASAIGGVLTPRMEAEKYPKPFTTALNITSSTVGLIIPPSNILIIYALASGGTASVEALFLAGYIPGILLAFAFILWAGGIAVKNNYPREPRVSFAQVWSDFKGALLSILMIIVVVGGIVFGVFTATEGAVVAVLYALILSLFYKELKWEDLPSVMLTSIRTIALILFLICTSMALSWLFAYVRVPELISELMLTYFHNASTVLLAINITLLIVGTFMDMTPAVLIFTPIFLPIVSQLGIHPVHFGIIMVLNLCIGLCTPPVGTLLFIGSGIANISVGKVIRPLLPLLAVMFVVLLLVTYFEDISLFLPGVFEAL